MPKQYLNGEGVAARGSTHEPASSIHQVPQENLGSKMAFAGLVARGTDSGVTGDFYDKLVNGGEDVMAKKKVDKRKKAGANDSAQIQERLRQEEAMGIRRGKKKKKAKK